MDRPYPEISWVGAARVLILAVGFLAAWHLRDIIVLLLTAIVIAAALELPISSLTRWGLPRFAAVLTIYLAGLVFLVGLAYLTLPIIAAQVAGLVATLLQAIQELEIPLLIPVIPDIKEFLKDIPQDWATILPAIGRGTGQVLTFLSGTVGMLFGTILVLVLSFYITLQKSWMTKVLQVIVPQKQKAYASDLWLRIEQKIGHWLCAQIVLALLMGALIFIGLSLLGVQYAFLLAVLAAVFNIVPILGPWIVGAIAFLVAAQQGLDLGIYTIIFFLIAQQIEAYISAPLIHQRASGLNPAVILLALLLGAQLAGFWGLIIAIPLAVAVSEFYADIEKQQLKTSA